MVFSSFVFLWIFLPLTLIGAYLTRNKGSNLFLLAVSLFFYAWGEPKYIVLLLFSITLNYFTGLLIEHFPTSHQKRWPAAAGVLINLLLLGYFKYYNFTAESINALFSQELLSLRSIALPVGISFYTFQAISYIVDLYRGTISVQRSWLDLALYISFFPQLIAGPIIQYKDIQDSLHQRSLSLDKAADGLKRFCRGLAKKVLIANTLGYTVDEILKHPMDELSCGLCWVAAVFYMLQIYFDFSGYSDMAIGLAHALGFDFPENFRDPYQSLSIREFWRRWHISLSTWFRNYLYIPLGGNRKGSGRTYLNLMVVFLATGLWHGAQWNFVFWGVYHGIFLILERWFSGKIHAPVWLRRVYTLLVVCIGWVFFRADDMGMAFRQLRRMVSLPASGYWNISEFVDLPACIALVFALILTFRPQKLWDKFRNWNPQFAEVLENAGLLLCLFLSLVMLANATHNPFIYFRF